MFGEPRLTAAGRHLEHAAKAAGEECAGDDGLLGRRKMRRRRRSVWDWGRHWPKCQRKTTDSASNDKYIAEYHLKHQEIGNFLPSTKPDLFLRNLRFLLWSKEFHAIDWAIELQLVIGPDEGDAWALILGSMRPSESALKKIASRFQVDPEDLLYADLMESANVNVVRNNLRMLMKGMGGGRKKLLAQHLKVHPGTISRWLSGTQAPDKKTLQYLASHFELRAGTDLAIEPLFLSPYPVSDSERRGWLLRAVEEIDSGLLSELFPALVRMLGRNRR